MINEEAIAILQVYKVELSKQTDFGDIGMRGLISFQLDAFDMAIEALSAEYEDYEHATLVDIKEPLKVLVVRCKDCRYFKKIAERSDSGLCHRDIVASAWKENGYCSRGERREP